ncbi:lipocalin family protein [Phycisphaeraceae bacterium D3-23]
MTIRSLTVALFATAIVLFASVANAAPRPAPAPLPDREHMPQTVEADDIQGHWELVSISFNGQTEHAPAGAMAFAFDADGTIRMYFQGQLADQGVYQADGPNLAITLNSDKVTEQSTYRVENGTLTITREIQPGQYVIISLSAAEATHRD